MNGGLALMYAMQCNLCLLLLCCKLLKPTHAATHGSCLAQIWQGRPRLLHERRSCWLRGPAWRSYVLR